MSDSPKPQQRSFSPDWFVQGILTKLGDTFDRLLGRGWKPSSSLATSELIERLKTLLDAEIRENGDGRRYVPHNIKLKMQWDKFSTDSDEALRKLEAEMLTAVVDHINDKRYYTYAPLSLEVKPDYFISGVRLFVSFDKLEEEREAAIHVSEQGDTSADQGATESVNVAADVLFRFNIGGRSVERQIHFDQGRRISVGRTKVNDLAIDDPNVSKIHASLLLNQEGKLIASDTGSTNGTFIEGQRIPYGKAVELVQEAKITFGTVEVMIEIRPKSIEVEAFPEENPMTAKTETFRVGEFEFTKRIEPAELADATNKKLNENFNEPAATQPAIELEFAGDTSPENK